MTAATTNNSSSQPHPFRGACNRPEPFWQWVERLGQIQKTIRVFFQETEKDFLTISNKLQHFHQLSSEIVTSAFNTSQILSSDEYGATVTGLGEVLNEFHEFLSWSESEITYAREAVETVGRFTEEITRALPGFKRIVKHLRIFGISTKIENRRLSTHDPDFTNLATQVLKLAESIYYKNRDLTTRTAVIHSLLATQLLRLKELAEIYRSKARLVLDRTRGSLNTLSKKHESGSSCSREFLQGAEQLNQDIGEIVVSIQYHDIICQQIEHVNHVLNDCRKKLQEQMNARVPDEPESIRSIQKIGEMLQLQLNQIHHGEVELSGAAEEIFVSLGRIYESINGYEKKVKKLFEVTFASDRSFLSGIEEGLASVVQTLTDFRYLGRELFTTITSISDAVLEMAAFINDIEKIGSEIELIALNAQVKAAHTGKEGAALGVLAESIQKVSEESFERTRLVTSLLQEIIAKAGEMKERFDTEKEAENLLTLLQRYSHSLATLKSMNEKIVEHLKEIQNRVQLLSSDLVHTTTGIDLQHQIRGTLTGIISEMEQIVNGIQALARKGFFSCVENGINHIEHHYTMSREREIHHSFLKGRKVLHPCGVAAEVTGERMSTADDLGENVEFFD